jgi:hypothetical protein
VFEAPPKEQLGKIVLIATCDASGFPHVTTLSLGELVLVGEEPRFLVIEGGTAARNIAARPELTLILVDRGLCCYIKGRGRLSGVRANPSELQPSDAVRIDIEVADVRLDSEAGAAVTSGPRYVREVPERRELEHWRRLREVLLQ